MRSRTLGPDMVMRFPLSRGRTGALILPREVGSTDWLRLRALLDLVEPRIVQLDYPPCKIREDAK